MGLNGLLSHLLRTKNVRMLQKHLPLETTRGTSLQPKLLKKLVSMDVRYGYCLPLPLAKATKIPNILIAPMDIQKQNTISEYGPIVPNDCLTRDQSFK